MEDYSGSKNVSSDKVANRFTPISMPTADVDLCRYLLHIPCNENYSSLNIMAAVQVVCYELFVAAQNGDVARQSVGDEDEQELATNHQMELFYDHLAEALADIGFMHPRKRRITHVPITPNV